MSLDGIRYVGLFIAMMTFFLLFAVDFILIGELISDMN